MAVFPCGQCGGGFPSPEALVDHHCYAEIREAFAKRTGLDPKPTMLAIWGRNLPWQFQMPSAFDVNNPEVYRPADAAAGKAGNPVPDHAMLVDALEVAMRRLELDDKEMYKRGMKGHGLLIETLRSALWRGDPAGRERRDAALRLANPGHAAWLDAAQDFATPTPTLLTDEELIATMQEESARPNKTLWQEVFGVDNDAEVVDLLKEVDPAEYGAKPITFDVDLDGFGDDAEKQRRVTDAEEGE